MFVTWDLCRLSWSLLLREPWSPQLDAFAMWDLCLLVASAMEPRSPLLCGKLVASDTWDLCCFTWSPPLRGLGRLRYVRLVASATWNFCRLVTSAMWDLCCLSWLPPLRETVVASAIWDFCRLHYVGPLVASVGHLHSLSPQLVASDTWDLCCLSWSPPLFVASVGQLR